jgi:hypothetical protein
MAGVVVEKEEEEEEEVVVSVQQAPRPQATQTNVGQS